MISVTWLFLLFLRTASLSMNLNDLFLIPMGRTPEKVAVEYKAGASQSTLRYRQLQEQVDRLAAGLQRRGVRKGDRVAFYLSNRLEFVVAYLAVLRVGAVMVPINLRYRRLEIAHILRDCMPRLLVTEQSQLSFLEEAQDAGAAPETLLVDELGTWEADVASLYPPLIEADAPALIMYTSGTTGRSKGAILSHNNVLATVVGLLAAWAWEAQDRLYLCLPLFHTHGLVVGLHCALAAGATVLLRPAFEGAATVQELAAGRATLFFAVPTIYVRLVDELRKQPAISLTSMRLFCSGSAPLAPETFASFRELTGHTILERYGMTETGMNLSNPYAGERVPGSVGTPLPGVSMRIVNHSGQDVMAGEEGELLVRGSNVFSGYWNAADKTAESFVHDALGQQWFRTGDLARQDADTGYVTLLGRRHELIISGGFNIYPREIEEMLATYPGIQEAAVIGAPHPEWGEVPVAYLVCEGALDEQDLVAYCRSQLASFKVPKQFHRVEQLPRNAMGKLLKHILRNKV
jgi:malonyl-CoA/methylmalonyl-CoA synthetase